MTIGLHVIVKFDMSRQCFSNGVEALLNKYFIQKHDNKTNIIQYVIKELNVV